MVSESKRIVWPFLYKRFGALNLDLIFFGVLTLDLIFFRVSIPDLIFFGVSIPDHIFYKAVTLDL